MLSIPIDQDLGMLIFDTAFPRNDYETKEQRKNADGVPQWSVSLILRQEDARRSESLTITIPSQDDPSKHFKIFEQVRVEGLRVMTGSNDGRTWVSFGADKIVPVSGAATPAKADK